MLTDIHARSGIRTHDPCVRAGEDISCLRPLGHYDLRILYEIFFLTKETHGGGTNLLIFLYLRQILKFLHREKTTLRLDNCSRVREICL
jgi:hypothetical protein